MYKKITAVAMVAVLAAMTASAGIIFDTTPRDDQANFTAAAGQTWMTGTLGTDNLLSTIRVDNRAAGAAGTGLYLAVYENDATAGNVAWILGTKVGVSSNTQDMDVDGGFALWNFSNEVLSDSTRYLFTFASDAAGTTFVDVSAGVTLNTGGTEQSAMTGGAAAFGGAHTMASQITTIPEPATLGLVAVFGGAVLFARRKMMI